MGRKLVISMPHEVRMDGLSRNFGDYDANGLLTLGDAYIFAEALERADPKLGRLYLEARQLGDEIRQICRDAREEAQNRTGEDPNSSPSKAFEEMCRIIDEERGVEMAEKRRRVSELTRLAQEYIAANYD